MKVKIQINPYKQLISKICSLVNEQSANPKEQNIELEVVKKLGLEDGSEIKKNFIKVTAVQNSVLKGTFSIPITESDPLEEGVVYLNAKALSKMTSSLPNEPYVIISLNKKKELVYKVASYGSVSESIYNDQDPFRGIQFYENKFSPLIKSINLSEGISALSKCTASPQAWFVVEGNTLQLYGQFSQSGFVKYSYQLEKKVSFNFQVYLNHANLTPASHLEECEIKYNVKPKSLKFISGEQEFILIGKEVCTVPFKAVNLVENLEIPSITVNLEELNKAVSWQAYGSQEGDGITLSYEDQTLIIKGSRVEEAAAIQVLQGSEFDEITLHTEALISALKTVGKTDHLNLSIANTNHIKILKLTPTKPNTFSTLTILYEQCNLNR